MGLAAVPVMLGSMGLPETITSQRTVPNSSLMQRCLCVSVATQRLSVPTGTSHLAPDVGWRLSLGLVGVPAVLVLFGSLMLPETPSNLMQRGREQEARKVSSVCVKRSSHCLIDPVGSSATNPAWLAGMQEDLV